MQFDEWVRNQFSIVGIFITLQLIFDLVVTISIIYFLFWG